MSARHERLLYLDGGWRASRGGVTADVRDPATGAVVGTTPVATAADVDDAVAAAARAFPAWARTGADDRGRCCAAPPAWWTSASTTSRTR